MNIVKPDVSKFLLPTGSRETTFAEEQAHLGYSPLPVIKTPDGKIASQWMPTPGELALLNAGVPVCHSCRMDVQPTAESGVTDGRRG